MERIVMPDEFDYAESKRIKKALEKKYPFLVSYSAGKTLCKRDIMAYSLGNYKSTVLFVGGFRGTERLTSLLLLRFLEKICESLKKRQKISGVDVSSAFMTKGITIVPCLNPDGTEITVHGKESAGPFASHIEGETSLWTKNAYGTDLVSSFGKAEDNEVSALIRLSERLPVSHAISFHSQGQRIRWSRGSRTPANSRTMADIFSVCSGYSADDDGNEIEGSFKNRFIDSTGRCAFTIETGRENIILPVTYLDELYDNMEELLVIGSII